ncbi:hypothetical protein PPERSA_00020 [Pseudocohnilembus persalinus]|uniref:Uncharacterized protein n=1 Tax=Pseudocohnilembus persalinus TaxID=266149 RepID=A0A0V0QUV8_PSEPJ|nr:hypothetical protein PPERSA_00020 [Pseudocohnilembus persalinus]|eukprot:KRX06140.1 hypothetical protein PPERSA_00020 [Pseudocohnilembus persalinus]
MSQQKVQFNVKIVKTNIAKSAQTTGQAKTVNVLCATRFSKKKNTTTTQKQYSNSRKLSVYTEIRAAYKKSYTRILSNILKSVTLKKKVSFILKLVASSGVTSRVAIFINFKLFMRARLSKSVEVTRLLKFLLF